MAMMYGDIDKSREKWNHINLIVNNLTKVKTEWENIGIDDLEKLVQEALDSALKLKGDI